MRDVVEKFLMDVDEDIREIMLAKVAPPKDAPTTLSEYSQEFQNWEMLPDPLGFIIVGMVVAEALAGDRTGGKMKLFLLAQKAFDEAELEVDAADLALIKRAVEQCTSYNNVIVGQALAALEEAK